MADIQYLNYGNLQIELLALLNTLADQVQGYVQKQPWSNKRKEKFMSAYSDLMNRGITGASNNTGQWVINVNGDPIDLNSMSRKDKEMYLEAAYFIQQQMAGLSTKELKKEDNKSKLPVFDNFQNHFFNYLSKQHFGGGDFNIGGEKDEWNYLDERDDKGIRGTTKRAAQLASWLKEFSDLLEDGKYNFEGSPFNDLADLKTRIGNAITKLNDGTWDLGDRDALNAIGLKTSDWFNNGSGDVYKTDGYEGTYGDYYKNYLPKLKEEKKAQQEQKLLQLRQQTIEQRANRFAGASKSKLNLKGLTPSELGKRYKSDKDLIYALLNYSVQESLDNNAMSEILGAYQFYNANGRLENISKEELDSFKGVIGYLNNIPISRLKKLPGVEGIYFDTSTNLIIRPHRRGEIRVPEDLLAQQTPEFKLKQYLSNTDFTDADWAELGGIIGDIVSIIDPEPISAAIAGVGAAGARNYARTRGPETWGFIDYLSLGFDYLTGAIGGIPGIGDAILGAKVAKNVVPWLRRAMRIPAFLDLWNSTPGLVSIGDKLMKGESLTVQDWQNLGTFFRGLATTRNLNVTNRASRKALLERGYEVSNRFDKKLGLTRSTPIGESVLPTIKMTINGKSEEIPINQELKQKLDTELSKKGNDIEARNKVIKENAEVLAAAEKAGFKVKEKVTDAQGKMTEKISDDWNNSSIVYNSSLRNARLFGRGITPSWARTSGETFGLKSNPVGRNYDNFENYLNSDRGAWDRFKYGSNRTLRGMDRFNSAIYGTLGNLNIEGLQYSGQLNEKDLKELQNALNPSLNKLARLTKTITPRNSTATIELIDGTKGLVKYGKNATTKKDEIFLIINGQSTKVKGNSLGEMKQNLGEMIKNRNIQIQKNNKVVINTNDPKWSNFVKSIKDLKRKGYLYKQGGKITDLQIENFLKQYK